MTIKTAKIDLRVTPERKTRIEKCAQAEGRTATGLITYVMDKYMDGEFVLKVAAGNPRSG